MPDITAELLPRLTKYHLPGLELGAGLVHPNYAGFSILNIPASICRWMGVPQIGAVPLASEVCGPFTQTEYRRVILILMDALALERLQRWMADGTSPIWGELLNQGRLAPLTSITPSTTSAALTTLWSGRSPTEHGLTGYEMWFKEYGMVGNTITHAPASIRGDAGGLERAGFKPEEALAFPLLGSHLAENGVQPLALQHASIVHSGLSRTFLKQVRVNRYHTAADLWVNLRSVIAQNPLQRLYAHVYWSEVDTLSHSYGPDDERTAAEFGQFSAAFKRLFLDHLNPTISGNTLLILTADHGAISTIPDPYYDLRNHPNLTRRLHLLPTGENRLAYLYIKPGQSEAVREYFERTWPNQFALVDSAYAVASGLFGPGEPHPALLDRVGDLIAIAKGNAYLWWANRENLTYGRHGGLSAQEMLVPFLIVSL